MAVKVQNELNIRKAKRWNEKDDAALHELLRKKTKEVNLAIKESTSPFMRSKLKAKRAHYKDMTKKVASGTYNGDIIFSEMQAAAALRTQASLKQQRFSNPSEARNYINSYEDMDLDYESYFRKTRYFGKFLPIIMILLSAVMLAFFVIGAFLPTSTKQSLKANNQLKVDTLMYFKLGPNEKDFSIKNDGNWPDGDWRVQGGVEQILAQGTPYSDPITGTEPEYVYLYTDLGLRTINISSFDIIKSWFRTKMLNTVRLDFLENNANFQGPSWFYAKYMESAETNLQYLKNEDGSFDIPILVKIIAGYGAIFSLIFAFLLALVCFILSIARLFTYTTRKFHSLHILLFFFSALAILLPSLMAMEGTEVFAAVKDYLMLNHNAFILSDDSTLMLNSLAFIPIGAAFVLIFLPKLFKNRLKKKPSFVPRGNKPRLKDKEDQMEKLAYNNVKRAYNNPRR